MRMIYASLTFQIDKKDTFKCVSNDKNVTCGNSLL